MSEGSKHGSLSNLPIRKPRRIPVMAPMHRIQSGCSTNAENNNPCPRGKTGIPRNQLGNRMKKPVLSEYRQNQIGSKPLVDLRGMVAQNEISRSTPDLSLPMNSIRPKHHRTQSGCSTNSENNNPYPCGQTGIPRNQLSNRMKKSVLSEYRQNEIISEPLARLARMDEPNEVSKSTPDLSIKPIRSKLTSTANNRQKINSLECLAKSKPKTQLSSRLPSKPVPFGKLKPENEQKKTKRPDAGKKTSLEAKLGQKPMDNKRKLNSIQNPTRNPKQKMSKEGVSSAVFPYSGSNSRVEDCSKIVKKIMLDKKMLELSSEKKRSSGESEDALGAFNSEEIMDLLMNDSKTKLESTRISYELDMPSKRNSSEFDDSISFFSDQMLMKLSKWNEVDDSMSSLFSDQMTLKPSKSNEFLNSKQNFFGDNLGSEELDNLTPELSNLSNAIDRTPSVEDLPMECEAGPETNTVIAAPDAVSARSTSPELPQESLSSRATNAAVSIKTSVTSIMSLDTGYQGDGELSRPESRNTENEPRMKIPIAENGIPVKTVNFDDGKTMTDSDFFTESEADVHDDLSAAAAEIGSGKGDRKAQVIDGTLYGGAFIQSHSTSLHDGEPCAKIPDHRSASVCNSINDDMASSGIYSDLEKKPTEVQPPVSYLGLINEQMKTIQILALLVAERKAHSEGIVKSSSAESSSTVQEAAPSARKSPVDPNRGTSEQPKKMKMPNRNVTSKVKALIETPASEMETRTKTSQKKGKWDAVMDKIAQGKEENKYTPSKFLDIKSKVFQSIGPLFNGRKGEPDVKNTVGAQSKSRSRRSTRIRSSESSLLSPKSKLSRTSTSPNSSQRSSLSDISPTGNPHINSTTRASKKRESSSPQNLEPTTPLAGTHPRKLNNNDDSVSMVNGATPRGNSDSQNGNVVHSSSTTPPAGMKTPSVRKTPVPRRNEAAGQNLQRTGSVPLKDSNHNGIVSKSGSAVIINNNNSTQNNNSKVKSAQLLQSKSLKAGARGSNSSQVKNGCLLAVAKETNKALLKQLKHNSRAFESLAILFAYCTNDLDAFATPHLKQQLEAEKYKVSQARSDLEELQSRLIRAREELNDREVVISELKTESDDSRRLVEQLKADLKDKELAIGELKTEGDDFRRLVEQLRADLKDKELAIGELQTEKSSLVYSLSETEKEKEALKTANVEIKEEYNKCLIENQRLAESRKLRGDSKEKSPGRASPGQKKPQKAPGEAPGPSSLESEVESLRQVLALKTDEVTELRRQELFLRENADRVPKLLSTIAMLEGKVEDLQTQLSSQTETARDLIKTSDYLEEKLKSTDIQNIRLAQKNEELQYKLKQYAEAMKQLASQTNLCEKNIKTEISPLKSNKTHEEAKSEMRGLVRKTESVSYMLDLTEDSSEVLSNIIRRAESLRSTTREFGLPRKRRSKATSASAADADSFKTCLSVEDDFRPSIASTPDDFASFIPERESRKIPSPIRLDPVRLDFSTSPIEVPNDNDCEIIEITKNFDKNDKMVTSTSSSSSSSNGSHFDIESDVFSNLENEQNANDLEDDADSSEFRETGQSIRTFRREAENIRPVLPVYADIDGGHFAEETESERGSFVTVLKVAGGEAMIGADLEKLSNE